MTPEKKFEYKQGMNNILKWGGTNEEKLSAFIQLVDEILEDN
jgi:hypothetical protein